MKYPKIGYHITYLDNLPNIKNNGLLFSNSKRKQSWASEKDRIYFFTDPTKANYIANHLSLDKKRNWVLLKIINLNPKYLMPDNDFGDTWQESIKHGGTFGYKTEIPSSDIEVFAIAKETKKEYHDEFRELKKKSLKEIFEYLF